MSFPALGLSPAVLKGVADAGYVEPTPIQLQAIPVVLGGGDVLGCAQTGTGKTASFTLPMLDLLAAGRARARMPRALILEPTRELAAQVAASFDVYGGHQRLSMALLIGGESFSDQERKLDRGVDIVVATPGRLLDQFERGGLLLSGIKILVIDEADRMLDMGFIPDVERIVSLIPKRRQTLFFSATILPEVRRIADAFLHDPVEITVAPPATPVDEVTQGYVVVDPDDKRDALERLLRAEGVTSALIFCNRKKDVDVLSRSLVKRGFNAAALHGDLVQVVRTATLRRFKAGEITLLVASDVAARGLDIEGLPYVFNYDVPSHAEDYIHRIGRTARAGLLGTAYMLATPEDGERIEAITALIGREIPRIEIPGVESRPFGEPTRRRGRSRRAGASRPAKETKKAPVKSREAEIKPPSKPSTKAKAPQASAETRGMGGHVPAFLLRPVPAPAPATARAKKRKGSSDADDLHHGEV